MGEAMKGVTKAMSQMNRQMNLPALQKIMREFEMQNEKMEMVSEVMGDALDDALGGDEEEEETEELVNQVLDEIGIDINSEVVMINTAASSSELISASLIITLILCSGESSLSGLLQLQSPIRLQRQRFLLLRLKLRLGWMVA
jgi:hypothetical protein